MKTKISIAIPVKNEYENIPELVSCISRLLSNQRFNNIDFEVLINNNASVDSSWDLIKKWADSDQRIKVSNLTNEMTFQETIQDMMKKATGDAFTIYQSDHQDPIDVLFKFIELWLEKPQIIVGVIDKRSGGLFSNLVRKMFYFSLNKFSDGNFINNFQDFYLLPRAVYKKIALLPSDGLFIRGYISSNFNDMAIIKYNRNPRKKGKTNFDANKKYSLAMDGLLLYGSKFIRKIAQISFVIFLLSLISIFTILTTYFFGIRASVNGWASLAAILMLLISLLSLILGIILEYLIRIYKVVYFHNLSRNDFNEK
jgi:glycosyltransferase involved in cell wall biosynthesis